MKGTLKGLTGLVIKPVTGILDATSKTAEGVKNTAIHPNDRPNEDRLRHPRPFYSLNRYITYYNQDDAILF